MLSIHRRCVDSCSEHDSLEPSIEKCPICLNVICDKSAPEKCIHYYCFKCIFQWSKIRPECPLCKKPFKIVRHNFKTPEDFLTVAIPEPEEPRQETTVNFIFNLFPTSPFLSDFPEPATVREGIVIDNDVVQRRNVYLRRLYVAGFAGPPTRIRPCHPGYYRTHTSQLDRIRPWIAREFRAIGRFYGATAVEQCLNTLCIHRLKSQPFQSFLARIVPATYLNHFIQELFCFATSAYDMFGFDQNARYRFRDSPFLTSDDDSEVEILDDPLAISQQPTNLAPVSPDLGISDSEAMEVINFFDAIQTNQVIMLSTDDDSQASSTEYSRQQVAGSSTVKYVIRKKRRKSRLRIPTNDNESNEEDSNLRRIQKPKIKRKQHRSRKSDFTACNFKRKPENILKLNPNHSNFIANEMKRKNKNIGKHGNRARESESTSDDD